MPEHSVAQTVAWTDNAGDNVWTNSANWQGVTLPTTGSIALIGIPQPFGATSGLISIADPDAVNTAASAGTILITAPWSTGTPTFTRVIANNPDAPTDINASISFPSAGGIDLNRSDITLSNTFEFGGSNKGRLELSTGTTGTSLTMRAAGSQILVIDSVITGTAQVIIDRVPGTNGDALVYLGDGNDHDYIETSDFTGGVKVNGGILAIGAGANPSSGGAIGRGTFSLAGGNFQLSSSSSTTIANAVTLDANVTFLSVTSSDLTLELSGTITFGGHRLTKEHTGELLFSNPTFATGTLGYGTLAVSSGSVSFNITGTNTSIFGGAVGEGTSGSLSGTVLTNGSGTFGAIHFRVGTLSIQNGTLQITNEGSGAFGGSPTNDANASRVNTLLMTVDGSNNPLVTLDLSNNEMVIDYTGTSPLSTGSTTLSTGLGQWIMTARNGGSWNGNGITTNYGAGTLGIVIGYGEAGALGYSTWSGLSVDSTCVLLKATKVGNVNLDDTVNIGDFSLQASNFNTPGFWTSGDCNYDGSVNISDFSLLAANFNTDGVARPTPESLPPVADLYVAMLQYPDIYWESWLWRDFWNVYFAGFEGMNLGPVPPVPEYLLAQVNGARGVPEPSIGAVALVMALPRNSRRKCRALPRPLAARQEDGGKN